MAPFSSKLDAIQTSIVGFRFWRLLISRYTMTDDEQLLRQYARERSELAFAELVARHIDLVFSAALRVVNGDTHLAQDVTQKVFMDLARKAGSLPRSVVLAGWLHRHTCYTAATAVRTERRRQTREQTAMEMRALDDNTTPPWELIAPYLDEALNQLNPADRDALVLRFLRQQDFRAVGAALGISEDAAQKRVSRALEKLRAILSRRGAVLSATALTAVLATETVTAAPVGLAAGVTAATLAAATETGITLSILKLMASTKLQTGIIGALVLASVLTPLAIQQQAQAKLGHQDETLRQQADRLAQLHGENERLSKFLARTEIAQTAPNEQFREVLKLRGEIGRLQTVLELAKSKMNAPLSHDEVLSSMSKKYSDQVNRIKQLIEANPAQAVPELQYLTDRQWLEVASVVSGSDGQWLNALRARAGSLSEDNLSDDSYAMSVARFVAQGSFSQTLWLALRQYGENNNGQFPTDLSQLTPYFTSPVDDSVLQGWTILPTSSLPSQMQAKMQSGTLGPGLGPDTSAFDQGWVITQTAPINADLDEREYVGLKTHGSVHGGNAGTWGPSP
jgi:RNA polymerase sigma factor (sigma-70 family)